MGTTDDQRLAAAIGKLVDALTIHNGILREQIETPALAGAYAGLDTAAALLAEAAREARLIDRGALARTADGGAS